mgnify:FL=1|tara:strand:+ start:5386 stop:5562 length:177 start_codon:yes stop_codon:yes gene_type:complete
MKQNNKITENIAQTSLGEEPTTTDEHMTGVIKLDDEYHAKAKINMKKVEKALGIYKGK